MYFCPKCSYLLDIKKSTNINIEDEDKKVLEKPSEAFKKIKSLSKYTPSFTKEEMIEWLEQLNQNQFKMIADHFQNMPKLAHTVEWTCPECKQKDSIKLEGLQSFFT